MKQFQ